MVCYNQFYIFVVENFTRQSLNEDSNITDLEEVEDASKLIVKAMDCLAA